MPLASPARCFAPAPGSIYLDTATYGLPPRSTVEAMQRALEGWQAGSADWIDAWDRTGDLSRERFARLIGVAPRTVALMPSVSVAVGLVAASLRPGDEVIVPDEEFASVLFPLLVAQESRGVSVKTVPLDALAESVTHRTTLVACSLVQSQSGRAPSLAALQGAAAEHGARLLLDATHAIPFVPPRPALAAVDYVVCAGYKHLLCPRGVAFLRVAEEHWAALPSVFANWRGAASPYGRFYGAPLDLAPDAARYDVSLGWFAWVGASESLRLLLDWQQAGLLAEPLALAGRLASRLGLKQPPATVLGVPVRDAERARAALHERGIRAAVRAGSVRLSPHVYNTADEIDVATEALVPFLDVGAYTDSA